MQHRSVQIFVIFSSGIGIKNRDKETKMCLMVLDNSAIMLEYEG